MASTPSTSTWHTVNPQTRPLTLSILELTPLALTLSLTLAPLSSQPSSSAHPLSQHVAHTHNHTHGPKQRKKVRHKAHSDDEDDHDETYLNATPNHSAALDSGTNFKDLLSHGVVVSVNGQPWNRIVAHVSDPESEVDVPETADGGDDEEEDAEWEDEPTATAGGDNAGGEEGGMVKRRPRKARFGSSAGNAVKGEDKGVTRRKRRPSEVVKEGGKIDRDRAVVVVYGLSPGKEYEIELQVVGLAGPEGAEGVVSNSVLIPPSPSPLGGGARSRANSLRSRSRPRSRSNSLSAPHPAASTGHSGDSSLLGTPGRVTPPVSSENSAPIPTNILNPIDTQAAQIRHMIAAAHAEKEHVHSQIKEARRASQRAEAALRLEIETVKKATEKAGSLDLRAKQKALALQEQVKQAWAGSEHAEQETITVEAGLGELEGRLESIKAEGQGVKDEWRGAKDKEEEIREKEKKARSEEEKKLAEVVGKIDKLRVKKEKKEAEKLELERKLQELLHNAEDIARKNEEEKNARKSGGAYWWDPYSHTGPVNHQQHGQHGHGGSHGHPSHALDTHSRTLTNHPSLNNLSSHGGFNSHRGRGFGGRYPSAGSVRPAASTNAPAPSPTHSAAFYSLQQPIPPQATSPAFRPPKPNAASPAIATRTPSSSGVNVSAMPFHPSNYSQQGGSSNTTAATGETLHTTLMPPQLQHRIYLPNSNSVRPRPQPNFNPPPSVLAERQSPTTLSAPSFPPLPGSTPTKAGASSSSSTGPSLASIVTRAVLSPTALAAQGMSGSNNGPVRSPTYPGHPLSPGRTATGSTASSGGGPASNVGANGGSAGSSTSPTPPASASSRAVTFGPPPERSSSEGFTIGATGPWSGLGSVAAGLVRTSTPPTMGRGRDSPVSSMGSGPGSRKGTAE